MTKIQEAARDIQDKYGWNLLPLGQFVKAADGKKEDAKPEAKPAAKK